MTEKNEEAIQPQTTTRKKKTAQEIQRLKEALETAQKENEALKDRLLRTAAELDNFRKRVERENAQIIRTANRSLLLDLLPVVDDLDRSLKTSSEEDGKTFREGIVLILQKFQAILRKHGVEPMESIGQPFDVEKHEALLEVEREGTPPGIVLEEHEKGYYLHGTVLRHAKVIVSK